MDLCCLTALVFLFLFSKHHLRSTTDSRLCHPNPARNLPPKAHCQENRHAVETDLLDSFTRRRTLHCPAISKSKTTLRISQHAAETDLLSSFTERRALHYPTVTIVFISTRTPTNRPYIYNPRRATALNILLSSPHLRQGLRGYTTCLQELAAHLRADPISPPSLYEVEPNLLEKSYLSSTTNLRGIAKETALLRLSTSLYDQPP